MNLATRIENAVAYIRSCTSAEPSFGMILGSGLGDFADTLENRQVIPFSDIPDFPAATVPGHTGAFVFGTKHGKSVVCLQGRLHYYEGHPMPLLTMPVRIMAKLGVRQLLLTNAAGGVTPRYRPGDRGTALVVAHNEPGYRCIVDNLHFGMLYDNELSRPVEVGEAVEAYVKYVRQDGKVDLSLGDTEQRIISIAERIMDYLRLNEFRADAEISDKMDPELIRKLFDCSKKDFKKAVGALYKEHRITISHPSGTITAAKATV